MSKKLSRIYLFLLLFVCLPARALGWVDFAAVSSGALRIVGWACDSRNRNVATGIHVWRDDGIFLGGGNAPNPREAAVAAACGSTNASHGFDISMQMSAAWLDNRNHLVRVYSVGPTGNVEEIPATNTNLLFKAPELIEMPRSQGDVVARDLAGTVAGPLGHLGFWDGRQVIEVLNERQAVQKNSYDNFRSRAKTWKPIYTNIPNFSVQSCFAGTCTWQEGNGDRVAFSTRAAMSNRAYQIFTIGASYTTTAWPTYALPNLYDAQDRRTTPAVRGIYRCDTFVRELFGFTNIQGGYHWSQMWGTGQAWPIPRVITGDPLSWKTNIKLLFSSTTTLPTSIYDRIKTF